MNITLDVKFTPREPLRGVLKDIRISVSDVRMLSAQTVSNCHDWKMMNDRYFLSAMILNCWCRLVDYSFEMHSV